LEKLDQWVRPLANTPWNRIINLSFSPSSSYLTDCLAQATTAVSGYSRTEDGFLNICDDASAYVYAQVGVNRANRIHLVDLFALVSGVELIDADFATAKTVQTSKYNLPEKYVVAHVGASQKVKSCSASQWTEIIHSLHQRTGLPIVVVGSREERLGLNVPFLTDLCGQTEISDLFPILEKASLLVGCDSVAIQIASLTNTQTLNISFGSVNFWETGPRAQNSRILWFVAPQDVVASQLAESAMAMLENKKDSGPYIQREPGFGVIYSLHGYTEDDWSWQLTRSLYMNSDAQIEFNSTESKGLSSLCELSQVAAENARMILDPVKRSVAISVLNEVDQLILQILAQVPSLSPVIRWFQTEKSRILPGNAE